MYKRQVLAGIDCIGFKDDSNQKLLQDINSFLEQYYDKIRHKEMCIRDRLTSVQSVVSQLVSLLVLPKKSVFGTWELKKLVTFQV